MNNLRLCYPSDRYSDLRRAAKQYRRDKDPNSFASIFLKNQCCPICLEKMNWISTLRSLARPFPNIKKIACGHRFHSKCINMIYKPQCPLCEYPIFNKNEEVLLKCNNTAKIIDLLKTYFDYGEFKNLYFYIKSQLKIKKKDRVRRRKRYFKILTLSYKYCDFTDILAISLGFFSSGFSGGRPIEEEEIEELIQKARINWHKTFNGKTFFDLIIEKTDNLSIINIILDKLPYDDLLTHSKNLQTAITQRSFAGSLASCADAIDDPHHLIYPSLQEPSAPSFDD